MNSLIYDSKTDARISILGVSGFLGRALESNYFIGNQNKEKNRYLLLEWDNHRFEKETDLSKYLDEKKPNLIYNSIALASLADCENQPDEARWLNAEIPKYLARKTSSREIKLVHISTDAVFGDSNEYRDEETLPKPLTKYGQTKWIGEQCVIAEDKNALVCRINIVGLHPKSKSLSDFFYSKAIANEPMNGFTNIYFTPLRVNTTSKLILELVNKGANGIYHVVSSKKISKYEFGLDFLKSLKLNYLLLSPVPYDSLNNSINRCLDLSLSNSKIRKLGLRIPSVEEEILLLSEEYFSA